QNLDRIVTTYPSTTLAVQIISGQSIGRISRVGIEQALLKARQVECSQHLRVSCILAEALDVTRTMEDSGERAFILADIPAAQAKAGNISTALEVARSIKSSWHRPRALADIAATQAKAGNISTALEIARSIEIEASFERTQAFSAIAVAQAKAGNV